MIEISHIDGIQFLSQVKNASVDALSSTLALPPTRLKWPGNAARMPATVWSSTSDGSLMILRIAMARLPPE